MHSEMRRERDCPFSLLSQLYAFYETQENETVAVIIGYILLAINLLVVIMMTTDKLGIYIDFHSFLCVFGGTFISCAIAFGPKSLIQLLKVYKNAIRQKHFNYDGMIDEVIRIARETKGDITPNFVRDFKTEFEFLKEGLSMIADGFSKEQIDKVLDERIQANFEKAKNDERMMKALTKIPPSMGLTGTTIGLVALFAEVGGADAVSKIGPAMAVALTATLYGVLCAFLILNPMTERVVHATLEERSFRILIKKAVLLMKERSSPVYVEEIMKSHATKAGTDKMQKKAA